MEASEWFWCLTHERPERGPDRDDPDNSLGPYPDEASARDWKRLNEERAAKWKADDEAWEGEDPDA